MNATTTKLYLSMAMELLHVATDKDLKELCIACKTEIMRREARAYLDEVAEYLRPDVGGPYNTNAD